MKRRVFVAVLLFACISPVARAHEGMIHVIGTITALTDKSVTVETTDKRSVEVVLVDTTTYEKASKPAARADLKVGDRVVIHSRMMKGVLQAHDVRFSEAVPSTH
jgi:hypothetical protein